MKRIIAFVLLGGLFFLALSPEWSILTIGEELAKSSFAIYLIQAIVVAIAIGAVAFIFFNFPLMGKKRFEE